MMHKYVFIIFEDTLIITMEQWTLYRINYPQLKDYSVLSIKEVNVSISILQVKVVSQIVTECFRHHHLYCHSYFTVTMMIFCN